MAVGRRFYGSYKIAIYFPKETIPYGQEAKMIRKTIVIQFQMVVADRMSI